MVKEPKSLKARQVVWDFIDEFHPHLWDDPEQLLSEPIMAACLRVLNSRQVKGFSRYDLRIWFADPAKNSPHVDDVAVERALNFDWDVIRALTLRERALLNARLAKMRDPFESETETARWGGNRVEAAPKSRRRLAFEEGTETQQDSLQQSVRTLRARWARERQAVAA